MSDLRVLVTQLSEEQQKLWQIALNSQGVTVATEPPTKEIVELLEQAQGTSELPNLVVMDIGITTANSTSLQARAVCRWCAENQPDIKVILTNPREDQVKSVGLRWAVRQGAIDLLPRLYKFTVKESVTKVLEALGKSPDLATIDSLIDSFGEEQAATGSELIREAATADLARKMAMIPMIVMTPTESETETTETAGSNISLGSTLDDLDLFDYTLEIDQLGITASNAFKENPLLPGIILQDKGKYAGMISRQRFLEYMSRPYSLELFSKRPLRVLYETAETEVLTLDGKSLVVACAQQCLHRPVEVVYEPVVVASNGELKLLDVNDLFIAQSKIHELATKLIRNQTQDRMVQTEKMVTLGEIVSEVTADISVPVNSIHSKLPNLTEYTANLLKLLETYERSVPISSEISEIRNSINLDQITADLPNVVNRIVEGTNQLKRMVTGLQSFSKVEEVMTNDIDVNECIENSIAILGARLKQEIKLRKNYGELVPVTGFAGQLIQVFMNLIGNAVDSLSELLTLAESDWQAQVEITTAQIVENNKNWIIIKIADNGSGIPEEMQATIFESFYKNKDDGKGKGLGLAISHQIVTQTHKGRISLKSPCLREANEFGGGTEFTILLPIAT